MLSASEDSFDFEDSDEAEVVDTSELQHSDIEVLNFETNLKITVKVKLMLDPPRMLEIPLNIKGKLIQIQDYLIETYGLDDLDQIILKAGKEHLITTEFY